MIIMVKNSTENWAERGENPRKELEFHLIVFLLPVWLDVVVVIVVTGLLLLGVFWSGGTLWHTHTRYTHSTSLLYECVDSFRVEKNVNSFITSTPRHLISLVCYFGFCSFSSAAAGWTLGIKAKSLEQRGPIKTDKQ